jgi:CubicO group peptidase (beta-lactamase class C family)
MKSNKEPVQRDRGTAWQTASLSLGLTAVFLFVLTIPPTSPLSPGTETSEPLAIELDHLLQSKSFSGSVLIAQDDHILLNQGYGYADRSRLIANTSQTRFRLGSVSKQFTAMAILMLQARGRLNVQDRICQYVDDCPTTWTAITIHQLLTHSSGMADYLALCFSSADQVQQTILKARNQPLAFKPGTRYAYSNVGYRVLAEIIEHASGAQYGQFLQKNIFIPLGMASTAFETTETPGLAVGYTNRFLPACPMDMAFEYGEGGINSTAEDLYRWDRALDAEQLIPMPLLQLMFTAHIPVDDQMGITGGAGYGWGVGEQLGHSVQIHGGFIQGFTSAIARFPNDRMTLIMLSNQQNYDESIYRLLVGKLLSQE